MVQRTLTLDLLAVLTGWMSGVIGRLVSLSLQIDVEAADALVRDRSKTKTVVRRFVMRAVRLQIGEECCYALTAVLRQICIGKAVETTFELEGR